MATQTKSRAYQRFHLVSLIASPTALATSTEPVTDLVLAETKSRSPLRGLLEKRSDYSFIGHITDEMVAQGVDSSLVAGAVDVLINRPTLAVSSRRDRQSREQGVLDVVQGVAVCHDRLGTAVLLVRGEIAEAKPPHATYKGLDVFLVATDTSGVVLSDEMLTIAVHLEELQRELRLKRVDDRPADAPRRWGLLGATEHRLHDVPADWQSQFESLGTILAMDTYFAPKPAEAVHQALHERLDVVVMFDDGQDWGDFRTKREAEGLDTIDVSAGSCFGDLISQVRREIVSYVHQVLDPPKRAPAVLQPGDTYFHRKISPQPKTHDRFSEGSTVGCGHGDMKRWPKADKAVKGMKRIYSNFDASMLYHCSKFPDCGVYIVRMPDRDQSRDS